MNMKFFRRGASSPPWFAALGWVLLGALIAGCQPRSATLTNAQSPRALFSATVAAAPALPASQAPFDETPITPMETVGAPAGEPPTETATTSR